MLQFHFFLKLLKESFRDLLPIVLVVLFFQLAVIQSIPQDWIKTTIGMIIVGFGLAIFLQGLEIGIFPLGENLANDFSSSKHLSLILLFGFLIGAGTTIAEPALLVIAQKAAIISGGRIDQDILRYVVAISVGFAIFIGIYRIIKGHPIHYYIIAGYILVVIVTFFAPDEIIGLAYDLGGVTTSTVTVPLVAAIGIGLATSIKGRNPVIDGFGLIAFASLTPMIFVQIYGIIVYNFVPENSLALTLNEFTLEASNTETLCLTNLSDILNGIFSVIMDVIPIMLVILFFQYIVLKKSIKNLKTVSLGVVLVIFGLYFFTLGLDLGLFSLGEMMAKQLIEKSTLIIIYGFAFAIGFSTTMAEPALVAIAKKASEISDGKINDFALRIFVAFGVAIGIMLGVFRIVHGNHIYLFIIFGYLLVVILTFFSPRYIIPVAYDSGGVTTSTVTVPLVTALGIGLASNIEGRSALIDGFGLIAFASLFPIITVMLYGIITEKMGVKSDSQIEKIASLKDVSFDINDISLPTIKIPEENTRYSSKLSFSNVFLIIPFERKIEAIEAVHKAGAKGVSIMETTGMGLEDLGNFYRIGQRSISKNVTLMFIVPDYLIDDIVANIVKILKITSTKKGVLFVVPLTYLKGISLTKEDIVKQKAFQAKKNKKRHFFNT